MTTMKPRLILDTCFIVLKKTIKGEELNEAQRFPTQILAQHDLNRC